MSLIAILWAFLKPFAWLLILPAIAAILESPQAKGWIGEQRVRGLIRARLDPELYREFYNVTVRTDWGTTQIDHVYVSPFGVFVIETKNMRHWIFGGAQQGHWTQVHFKVKKRFSNPIWQNYGHVKALESLLGLREDQFHSVVVFAGDSTFKSEMPNEVCTCSSLIEYMRSFDTRILSAEEVDVICRRLEALRLAPTLQTHRAHVESLRRRHGMDATGIGTPARAAAEALVQVSAERLVWAAGSCVRSGGRRYATRAVEATLGVIAIKALIALLAMFLIWWAFTSAVSGITRSIAKPVPEVTRSQPTAVSPHPIAQQHRAPTQARSKPPPPIYYHPGGDDVSDSQRRADEGIRALAPNTPEIPLTFPDSSP